MKRSIKFRTISLPLLIAFALPCVVLLAPNASAQPPPGTLWYNGDLNGSPNGIGLGNKIGADTYCTTAPSQIYDDFNVPSPFGWNVTEVFSDNIVDPYYLTIVGAIWEIRQGVSAGNPGILIASGFTLTPNITATGRQGGKVCDHAYSLDEERVTVTGLNLFLSPGQYWLDVTPIFADSDYNQGAYNSVTIGADCVGTPCGNNGNAFIKNPGNFWDPTTSYGSQYGDFAMGMVGTSRNLGAFLVVGAAVKQGFQIPMPINGGSGIEDRSGQPGGAYTITMTFNENIASVGRTSASCGKVTSTSIDGATLTINLTKVSCNASHITVTANDVKDSAGIDLDGACLEVGLLLGDVDGNGVVDSSDIAVVDSQLGQPTNEENLRSDVNNNGVIDNADLQIVTRQQGTYLP